MYNVIKRSEILPPKALALLRRVKDMTVAEHNEQVVLACNGLEEMAPGIVPDHHEPEARQTRYVELDFDETVGVVEESIANKGKHGVSLGSEWTDGWAGSSPDKLLRDMVKGTDSAALEVVDRMVEEVGFHLDIETPGARTTNSLVGGSVATPRYMQNIPTCMRRRELDVNNAAPVRVVCDGSSSANVDDDSLAARSAAVLALVEVLNQHRPVEFWLATCGQPSWTTGSDSLYLDRANGGALEGEVSTSDHKRHCYDTMCLVRVGTHPIDISRVAAAMSQAYIRRFMYGVEYFMSGAVDTVHSGHLGWPTMDAGILMKRLPTDIVVPPLHCNRNEEMLNDSVKWVADNVAAALNLEGAAYNVDNANNES